MCSMVSQRRVGSTDSKCWNLNRFLVCCSSIPMIGIHKLNIQLCLVKGFVHGFIPQLPTNSSHIIKFLYRLALQVIADTGSKMFLFFLIAFTGRYVKSWLAFVPNNSTPQEMGHTKLALDIFC